MPIVSQGQWGDNSLSTARAKSFVVSMGVFRLSSWDIAKMFETFFCLKRISKSRKQTMKAKVLNLTGGAALALIAGVITAINPSPAHAVDTKNYPGALCVRTYGSGGTYVNWWAGGISNDNDNSSLDITCPVIKDVVTQGINSGKIRVWDTHYTQNIECRLNSFRFETRGHAGSMTPVISSRSGNDTETLQELVFGAPSVPVDSTNSNSHYFYTCKIPPRYDGHPSFVSSYSVIENGQNE